MSHLSHLAKRVIEQYIDLLPEKLRRLHISTTNSLDSLTATDTLHTSGKTEASSAEEQLAEG